MGEKPSIDFDRAASMFIDTSKLGISKASWMLITKDHPGVVLYKRNYSDILDWESCRVLKPGINVDSIFTAELSTLPKQVPLNESKTHNAQVFE